MSISRPFAYNTGDLISGTTQSGDIAIGSTFGSVPGGSVHWWNGPDEELGYIIAYVVPDGTQPTPDGNDSYIGFWRSSELSDSEFISICNHIPERIGESPFTNTYESYNWLFSNGYWTNFPEPEGDFTPDVVTWSNIPQSKEYITQQISGIDPQITLRINIELSTGTLGEVYYKIDESQPSYTSGFPPVDVYNFITIVDNETFSITNSQWLSFSIDATSPGEGNIGITNDSDSGSMVGNTFSVNWTIGGVAPS